MKLTQAEEELMNILWKEKKAGINALIAGYPEPRPATTTVATLLKRMIDKGFVGYTKSGRSRIYSPLVRKQQYFSDHVNGLIRTFFNNSASQFASFFTRETDLSKEELEELKTLIDQELRKK